MYDGWNKENNPSTQATFAGYYGAGSSCSGHPSTQQYGSELWPSQNCGQLHFDQELMGHPRGMLFGNAQNFSSSYNYSLYNDYQYTHLGAPSTYNHSNIQPHPNTGNNPIALNYANNGASNTIPHDGTINISRDTHNTNNDLPEIRQNQGTSPAYYLQYRLTF